MDGKRFLLIWLKGVVMKKLLAHSAFYLILASAVLLGSSLGIEITGSLWMQDISPGDEVSQEITLGLSQNDTAANYTLELFGLDQNVQGINIPAEEDASPYSAVPFIEFSKNQVHLEPNSSEMVLATAKIPQDVGEGARYAIISVKQEEKKSKKRSVGVTSGVNIPVIFILADSELNETGEISKLDSEEPINPEMLNISILFNNTGNMHYKAKAEAELKDANGEILGTGETPVSFSSIVPPFAHQFDISIKPGTRLEQGTYNLTATVKKDDGTELDKKQINIEF